MQLATYTGHYRAGVIGHTGKGSYGHGLDMVFVDMPNVHLAAIADPDAAGCRSAVARTGADRGYASYVDMLQQEALELLAIGPRWVGEHEDMVIAAAHAGVKAIYSEKPFARTLAEADRMLDACTRSGTKIAVAHQNRVLPAPRLAEQLIAEGKIGRLRVMHAYGKMDERGGGQDLYVLGVHLLDMMRRFAGDARWCNARVMQAGQDATAADVAPTPEEAGLMAGDELIAAYGFDHGVTGTFESLRNGDSGRYNLFRLELCGTDGILAFWSGPESPVYFYPGPFVSPTSHDVWQRLQPEALPGVTMFGGIHTANQMLVSDLLAAVEQGRDPVSSGAGARDALEMVLAVYASHRLGARVALPLVQREHPLHSW